ncbi:MAG: hypothetical protein ACXVEF_00160 [Polyangiales bacterium]
MRFLLPSLVLVFAVGCGGSVTDSPAVDEDSGATGDDSSASGDSTTPGDDSTTPGDDAVTPPDDAPATEGSVPPTDGGSMSGTITCGMTTCDAKTQQCCVSFSMAGATSKCVATGTCMGMGSVPLACTDSTVCATGEVCCARLGGGGSGSSCQKTCMMGTRLCATDAECRMGEKCTLSMFTGLKSCRATGGGFPDAGGFDVGFPKPDVGGGG